MPFVKKSEPQGTQPPTDARKIFIGREGELHFFVQSILKPGEPTHNIVSISGQGGVGKSTLLLRLIAETRTPEFKDYCLAALVDERQITPVSIMEKFAEQLHIAGEFEKALQRYKEALRNLQSKREAMQDTLLYRTPDIAGAAVEGIPFAGPLLREGTKVAAGQLINKYHTSRKRKDVERLEDPIEDLTKAFVEELNRLADTRVKHRQRIILFFDTFERLAVEAVPWLLDHFLEASISNKVVLVAAGRDPIERSTPDDPKRWLPYLEDQIIYSISLDSFTLDETRAYLAERGISDPERIETIWQLSHGLPLYLGLLTTNPLGKADPTKDVVVNFLRWIPEDEQVKRQIALDAALVSRPFNLDDLEAFPYLPENERTAIYTWLIGQPFVRPHGARYAYHELAQELFSRQLYQRSRKGYHATRRALADHYKEQLENILAEGSEEVYGSDEWRELVLALAYQLFLLPNEASHIKAIEQVLNAYKHSNKEQEREITRVLRELSREQLNNQASIKAQQVVKQLQQYIEADPRSQDTIAAASTLLELVAHESSFPSKLLAGLYRRRGGAYWRLEGYQHALNDFNRALELAPDDAWLYEHRGYTYIELKDYQHALADYDHALELNPNLAWAYSQRGTIYRALKDYQQALSDFNRALELAPQNARIYYQRGLTYRALKDDQHALADYNHALDLAPNVGWLYVERGLIYTSYKDYQRALVDLNRALELEPMDINTSWMAQWVRMCQEKPDTKMSEQLNTIVQIDPQHYVAYVCRGVADWLSGEAKDALIELEQAIILEQGEWDAHFWKGMAYASMGRDEEAMAAIEKSLELELPPILLTPLRWFEQDRPEFYEKYVVPLLARYEV